MTATQLKVFSTKKGDLFTSIPRKSRGFIWLHIGLQIMLFPTQLLVLISSLSALLPAELYIVAKMACGLSAQNL